MMIDVREDLLANRREELGSFASLFRDYDKILHKYCVGSKTSEYFEELYGTDPSEFGCAVMIFDCQAYLRRFYRGMAGSFWPDESLINNNLDYIFDGYEELRHKLDKLSDYQYCLANLMPAPVGFTHNRWVDGKGNRDRDNGMPDLYYKRAKSDFPHMRQWIDENMEKYSLQVFREYESYCEDGRADEPVTDDPVELVPFVRSVDNAIACIEYRAMKMINRFYKRPFKGYTSKEWLLNGDICYI